MTVCKIKRHFALLSLGHFPLGSGELDIINSVKNAWLIVPFSIIPLPLQKEPMAGAILIQMTPLEEVIYVYIFENKSVFS